MPFNLGDLGENAKNLGKDLLDGLTGDLLKHVTSPEQIDLATRATATMGSVPIMAIGASAEVKAQAQEDYNSAMTVLLSLASADAEDAASDVLAAQLKVRAFVANFIQVAISTGIKALILA